MNKESSRRSDPNDVETLRKDVLSYVESKKQRSTSSKKSVGSKPSQAGAKTPVVRRVKSKDPSPARPTSAVRKDSQTADKLVAARSGNGRQNLKLLPAPKSRFNSLTWLIILAVITTLAAGVWYFKYRIDWEPMAYPPIISLVEPPRLVLDLNEADFEFNYNALTNFTNREDADLETLQLPQNDEEIRARVIDKIARDETVRQLGEYYNLKVTPEDIEAEVKLVELESGSLESFEQTLADLYGWDLEDFKSNVVYYALMEEKLQNYINQTTQPELTARADYLLEGLNQNQIGFAEAALRYSDDPSVAQNQGDLGLVSRGLTVPEFESAIFSLGVGEITGPITTSFGVHIINVYNESLDPSGQRAGVNAKHILFSYPAVEEIIRSALETAEIKVDFVVSE